MQPTTAFAVVSIALLGMGVVRCAPAPPPASLPAAPSATPVASFMSPPPLLPSSSASPDAAAPARTAALAATPLTGKLWGQPFAPKKTFVYRSHESSYAYFADEAGTATCRPEHTEAMRYVMAVSTHPFVPGEVLRPDLHTFMISTGMSSGAADAAAELTITSFGGGHAKGVIAWRPGPDQFLEGAFDAVDCPTKAKLRDASVAANGLVWEERLPPVSSVPSAPVTGFLAGEAFTPAAIELVGFESSPPKKYDFPRLRFHTAAPKKPCARFGFDDGFEVSLKRPIVPSATNDAAAGGGANMSFHEISGMIVAEDRGSATIVIDSLDRKAGTAHGKLVASFNDPSKSLLVGGFTARYCRDAVE